MHAEGTYLEFLQIQDFARWVGKKGAASKDMPNWALGSRLGLGRLEMKAGGISCQGDNGNLCGLGPLEAGSQKPGIGEGWHVGLGIEVG